MIRGTGPEKCVRATLCAAGRTSKEVGGSLKASTWWTFAEIEKVATSVGVEYAVNPTFRMVMVPGSAVANRRDSP